MKGLGICAWSLPLKGEELYQWLKDHGVQNLSVEFPYETCKDDEGMQAWCREQKDLAAAYGIELSILAVNIVCRYGMSHKENEPLVRHILERAVITAAALGTPAIHMPSFVNGEIHSQEELDQTIACLQYACELGEKYNVWIGHESPLPEDGVQYVLDRLRSEKFYMLFDNENVSLRGIDPRQLYRRFAPLYRHTHLKTASATDTIRPLCQEQSFDGLASLAEVMRGEGFDGWVILETSYKKEPDRAAWESVFEQDRAFILEQFA